jgi:long-chain acyl-CoA synthetase
VSSQLAVDGEELAAAAVQASGSLDGLLRQATANAPERSALRIGAQVVSFAELDAAVDGFAAALAGLLAPGPRTTTGGVELPGAVVGVAAALHPAFPIAYYGSIRAGHVCAVVNPLQGEDELAYGLELADVEVLVATADMVDRLKRIRLGLPRLVEVMYLDRPGEPGARTIAGLASRASKRRVDPVVDPHSVACAQFTSGTTGRPKAVLLTHRNLVCNAVQIAQAHGLGADSVTMNHLPTYHPMHLNSAVYAEATQVLCVDPDPAHAVAAADRYSATHFYSLPVRLARTAADPRLINLKMRQVRVILSGGSALAPSAAARLAENFGVPVVQGYGLAETSPLTHCDRFDQPKAGSVGLPVAGTECRVVDVDRRSPLPAGQPGEVQVRGPQVMAGYLARDRAEPSPVDQDGWLDTGDVGYLDDEGWLFLVDRIKDVFKCDNWLVSPTEIERVLARHPAIADCVVVDLPDEFRGAVAYALAVVAEPEADPAEIIRFVNSRLPDYQHLHGLELVGAIPRSAIGKVRRRDIRTEVQQRHRAARSDRSTEMVTIINRFTVNGDVVHFEQILRGITAYMSAQPGFMGHRLFRSRRRPEVFIEMAAWADAESHGKAMQGKEFHAQVRQLAGICTPEPDLFDEVGEEVPIAAS